MPTIVSYSWLQLRMEQNVDSPAPGRGGRISGLQGFLPEQSSTAQLVAQERRSLILVRLVEAFKSFAQVRVLQRRLEFLLDTLVKVFFSHFSPKSKKCEVVSALGVGTECGLYFIHAGSSAGV